MIWIELRKAIRSKMPLWTALGSLFMPIGIAFLIFVARNPEISQKLGLVSAKANLMAYSATDWPTYLGVYGQIIAVGGFFLFVLVISWVFGREFADSTVKDMLAIPVQRSSVIMAKFIIVFAWSAMLAGVIFIAGLITGAAIHLPGGSINVILQGCIVIMIAAFLTIAVVMPFALFASMGRGYLLPIGTAILAVMMGNLSAIIGWGEYFPWAIPGLYAQAKSHFSPISFWIVILTGFAGMTATYLWWEYSDQNR
jgi:ABC-2 type transport system permease protein